MTRIQLRITVFAMPAHRIFPKGRFNPNRRRNAIPPVACNASQPQQFLAAYFILILLFPHPLLC